MIGAFVFQPFSLQSSSWLHRSSFRQLFNLFPVFPLFSLPFPFQAFSQQFSFQLLLPYLLSFLQNQLF